MNDLYFFKKVRETQWLGLRIPAGLQLEVGEDGTLKPPAPWSYAGASPRPAWAAAARLLVLQVDGGGIKPALVPAAASTQPAWQPFQQSQAALANAAALPDPQMAQALSAAMGKAIDNPLLPLRMYQAYRDFPAQPRMADYARDEDICMALIGAVGGSATDQPIEAYSELLVIVDSDTGPTVSTAEIDVGDADAAKLRVTAHQAASSVTLQLELDGKRITNGTIVGQIHGHSGVDSPFAPFYRWRRTLGVAERPSGDSGAVLIPSEVKSMRDTVPGGVGWAERAFRVADRLGPRQLAGELLNYELRLFNPHGRCTHSGRVLLKRQRLDPPAPPVRGRAQLLAPEDGTEQARCSVSYTVAADQADPWELKAVIYRQDYPVVPTGFYGDDDDGALTVARSLGDLGGEGFVGGQFLDEVEDGGEALPNLSSHNLDVVDTGLAKMFAETEDGEEVRRVEFTITLEPGHATRLFLALRREVEGDAVPPESQVALLQHLTGTTRETARAVPHFERFWAALPGPVWLGEGSARLMEVEGEADVQRTVRVVIQHTSPDAAAGTEPDRRLPPMDARRGRARRGHGVQRGGTRAGGAAAGQGLCADRGRAPLDSCPGARACNAGPAGQAAAARLHPPERARCPGRTAGWRAGKEEARGGAAYRTRLRHRGSAQARRY